MFPLQAISLPVLSVAGRGHPVRAVPGGELQRIPHVRSGQV